MKCIACLGIVGHLRGRFARFKLGTHFLDLSGLLFELGCESLCLLSELGCESLYLFLLLRDRYFQLLNFAIDAGLARTGGAREVAGALRG